MKSLLNIPLQLNHVATLPCEISAFTKLPRSMMSEAPSDEGNQVATMAVSVGQPVGCCHL